MPPISNPGSRTGLISALVAFALLFAVATIFAIYMGVQNSKLREDLDNFRKKYTGVVSEANLNSPTVDSLKAIRQSEGSGFTASTPLADVAWTVSSRMAQMVGGTGADPGTILSTGMNAIADAGKKLEAADAGVTLPNDSFIGALNAAVDAIVSRQTQIAQLNTRLEDADAQVAAAKDQQTQFAAAKEAEVAAAREDATNALAAAQADRSAKDAQIGDIESAFTAQASGFQNDVVSLQARVADLDSKLRRTETDLRAARERIGRGTNTADAALRQGDGQIVRIAGDNVVYINLGTGDQISPGLTFEVYDRVDGVPLVNSTDPADDGQAQGKASIEVTRVGATSSEARIIRATPGTQVTEGDVIANLIYDPNTKFAFMVYGNFDLDQNGVATAGDANVIRQLVANWGGRITDQVSVDADFVVLGREPELPSFSREDLEDPINRKRFDDAQASLAAYNEVIDKAQALNIPLMNQNRFLYYIGYYDQAQR